MPVELRKRKESSPDEGANVGSPQKRNKQLAELLPKDVTGQKDSYSVTAEDQEVSDGSNRTLSSSGGSRVDASAAAALNTVNESDVENEEREKSTIDEYGSVDNSLYPSRLLQRISVFSDFSDDSTTTYAVSKVPARAEWGARRSDNDLSDKLCPESRHEPITLWAVGKIKQLYFSDRSGTPLNHVAIHVQPFSKKTMAEAHSILRRMSHPQEQSLEDSYGDLRASRWQTSNLPGYRNVEACPFQAVYDAREVFQDKNKMHPYDVNDLKFDDVVLVEMYVSRYRIKDDTSTSSPSKQSKSVQTWNNYKATFQLQSICLLFSAPFMSQTAPVVKSIGIVI